ncbi:MAG: flippase-like domain-containing protein [Chitinophagaceae bacterium]|nr:MAG: flippase-like domain-containing protein [Chitinophagaceae bacterium]
MRKKVFSILQYIIFLGGGIFLVWWQLRSMTADEKSEFNNALWSVNYWLMIPVVGMSLLSHLSRSMRWKLLMEPLGYKPKLKNVFASTMVGYLANSAIPRLGEVLKCSLLSRYEKLKFDKLFGTILVERAFDFVCYLVFIGITILLQIDLIGGYVKDKVKAMDNGSGIPFWGKLIMIVGALAAIVIALRWMVKTFPQNKVINSINGFLKGIGAGFASIKNLKHKRMFLVHTLIIWALYMLQIYIGFSAMQGTEHLSIKAAFSVLSLATLAMIATPGGIGSFPIFVMETLLIYSIASPLGKAFGWLIWGANTAIVIVAGLISLLLLPYMNRKKEMGPENVH